jgi:hypothetical protein
MRKGTLASIGLGLIVLGFSVASETTARGAVPGVLTQQGRLIDKATSKPATGSVSIKFAIYDAAMAGTELWTETQMITLDDGYFSARLGETTPIPATVFDGKVRHLGVTVGTDSEMTPREALTSVPYALVAGDVNGPINPTSVSIAGIKVIDETGKWVGPAIAPAASNSPRVLPFMPLNNLAGCAITPVHPSPAGSTASTTNVSIGTMYFDQGATWLKSSYTKARLQVTCRGNGVIELRSGSCGTVVTTINCSSGSRPWTAASAEFVPATSIDYDVVARATSGTLEYANPALFLY